MPIPFAGELAALATSLMFSVGPTFFTLAGLQVGSVIVNRSRLVVALAFLALIHWLWLGAPLPVGAEAPRWFWLSLSGVIGLTLGDAALFQAFVQIGARLTMLVFSISPVIGALLAWMFLGETLTARQMAGIAVTIGGILLVLLERGREGERQIESPQYLSGLGFALLAGLGQAGGLVTAKLGLYGDFLAISGQIIRMLAATIAIWLFTFLQGRAGATLRRLREQPQAVRYIVLGSLIGPVVGVWFSLVAIQYTRVGVASTLMSLPPIFLLPIGYYVFKERFGWRAVLGTAVALAGVALLFLS